MSLPYVVDGETELSSELFNPIIGRVNGEVGPLANMRAGMANVLDYALAGDGTTDNSTALAAMLSGTQAGSEYYFPPGDYLCGPSDLTDLRHFVFHPGAVLRLKDNADTHLLRFGVGSDGSSLRGGRLDGNGAHQSGGYGVAILAPDVTLDGVTIENAHSTGVYGVASTGAVRNCKITNSSNSGILVNCTGHATFYDWDISGNRIDLSALDDSTANVKGIGTVGQDGSSRHVYRNRIANNTVLLPENPASTSILGIEIWGGSEYSAIVGNVVNGGYYGISANHAHGSAIAGNVVVGAKLIGIELAESNGCAVAGNTVDGTGITQNGIASNVISGTYGYSAITGNAVRNVTQKGIHIYRAVHMAISGNAIAISDASASGIYLQVNDAAYATIGGNLIDGAGTAVNGITLNTSDVVAIAGNTISGFATAGIRLYATTAFSFDDLAITGNTFAGNADDWAPLLSGGAALGSRNVIDIPSERSTYTFTNVTTDRSLDADSTTTAELADALGTLIADLRTKGVVS